MAKVMLVEDDNNLREIYEARLAAEGYEIVSAADGEAALALAIKEKPDLIISDIMMPKVSGFDMLDILRSTTETKNCKIIMMTALNQAEDKARAEKLGADMYLVKSQVTLEDVVRAAKGVLGDQTPLSVGGVSVQHPATPTNATSLTGGTPAPAQTTPTPAVATPAAPVATPPAPAPAASPQPTPTVAANSTAQEEAALQAQIEQFIASPTPAAPAQTTPTPAVATPAAPVATPPAPAPAASPQPTPTVPPQPVSVTTSVDEPAQIPTPTAPPTVEVSSKPLAVAPTPPQQPESNDTQTATLNEDKPAGEQIIVKSASAASSGEPGIDASISGRKKVIQPITDITAGGPDLNALAAKETGTPASNMASAVITPSGATIPSTPPAAPTMSDIISPSATPPTPTGTTPLPPPVA